MVKEFFTMSDPHSSEAVSAGKPTKPPKPTPDFPLFAHPNGSWAKKIRGKCHYFGPWADPDAALAKYNREKDALHSGRKPHEDTDALTVKQMVNHFLNAKAELRDVGELSPRTWDDYKAVGDLLVDQFDKSRLVSDLGPDDFVELRHHLAKKFGPVALGNRIQRIRVIFKYASDNTVIDRPVQYGSEFKRPSKKTIRVDKATNGPKLFTPVEISRMLGAATLALKAMILLGIFPYPLFCFPGFEALDHDPPAGHVQFQSDIHIWIDLRKFPFFVIDGDLGILAHGQVLQVDTLPLDEGAILGNAQDSWQGHLDNILLGIDLIEKPGDNTRQWLFAELCFLHLRRFGWFLAFIVRAGCGRGLRRLTIAAFRGRRRMRPDVHTEAESHDHQKKQDTSLELGE
jgi:hypothetical protein